MALDRILPRTRRDLQVRMASTPLHALKSRATLSTRSFHEALARPHTGMIMECKKASPSRGLIRSDFDVASIANAYKPFADAISVLTDAPFFQGSHDFLSIVAKVSQRPVLCKDFVVDPYQIYEARCHGAHAVLLMLSVLDDATYRRCVEVVAALGMDALTEVHDEHELERALSLGAPMIGINNRDLTTLNVDLNTTRKLAPLVPDDRIVICESGVFTHEDVRSLRDMVDGFLVGTSLMKQARVDLAARGLVFGDVKVCGLTSAEDAQAAYDCGASFGGLIFAPRSPRRVSLSQARSLTDAVPQLQWVGVFVNAPVDEVAATAQVLGLRAVQLHGDEDGSYINALKASLSGDVAVWKAHRVQAEVPLVDNGADALLLDTYQPGVRGGTGVRFDWSVIPETLKPRVLLSGGLNPSNAAEADTQGVLALDVNSGVEAAPGLKDQQKLDAFFAALRG